jgi:hypothetical protein
LRIGEATNWKDLSEALRDARQRRLEMRRGYETIWWNNLALLAGDHFTTWNPNTGELIDTYDGTTIVRGSDESQYRVMLAVNQALTVFRTELAKATKSRPVMEVVARSDEPVDLAAAKVGKQALEAAEWKYNLRQLRKDALSWTFSCGVAGVYVGYDPDDDKDGTRKFVIDPQTKDVTFNPVRIEELSKMLEKGELDEVEVEEYALGDCCFKVFSPFQMLPDPTKLDFDEIQDIITTEVMDVDAARDFFGDDKIMPEPVQLGTMEKRAIARAGIPFVEPDSSEQVQIHTYWLLPNYYKGKFLSQGLMCHFLSDGTLLEKKQPYPYADKRIPIAFFKHIPSPMSIWPDSILQHIRSINIELDKAVSQIIEAKDYMANPMWRVATQHRIKGKIRSKAGNIVRYVHVPNIPPPEPLPGVPVPAQVENLVVLLRDQILDISGQGETSRGKVPSGVRSGVAVAYLQEEDDTKLGPTAENIELAVAKMGSLTLSRFGQYYSVTRLMRYYRRDGFFDVIRFKGADLAGVTDVIPVAGTALPRNRAARQQNVLDMVSMGVIRDPKKIADMLEIGEGEPDDVDKAWMQADRENNLMLRGIQTGRFKMDPQHRDPKPGARQEAYDTVAGEVASQEEENQSMAVPVYRWHNHAAHLQRHYSMMMDEEFERLTKDRPEIVRLFNEHTAMHEQEMQRQQQEQMQMMMAAKGAPGELAAPAGGPPQAQQNGAPQLEGRPDAMQEITAPQSQKSQR